MDTATTEEAGAAGARAATAYVYADVPNRLVGIVFDAVLLSLLAFAGAVAVSAAFGPVVRFDLESYTATVDERLAVANAVVSAFLGGAYFVGSYVLLRATPGHRVLGMTLHGAEGGARLSLSSALVRWLLLGAPFAVASILMTAAAGAWDALAAAAVAAWYLVLLVSTAIHPAKRGLHDRLARTTMVKAARVAATRVPVRGEVG